MIKSILVATTLITSQSSSLVASNALESKPLFEIRNEQAKIIEEQKLNLFETAQNVEVVKGIELPEYTVTKTFIDSTAIGLSNNSSSPLIPFILAVQYSLKNIRENVNMGYKVQFYSGDATMIGLGAGNNLDSPLVSNLFVKGSNFSDFMTYLWNLGVGQISNPVPTIGFRIKVHNFLWWKSLALYYVDALGKETKIIQSNSIIVEGNTSMSFVFSLSYQVRFY